LALAGDDWIHFAFRERLGMTAILLATPLVGTILGLRMNRFRGRSLDSDRK